jgi:protein-tyrosine phosphatase
VDLHCHILPGVDDGPSDWETTIEMCRIASEDGISHIVATPHANAHYLYDRNRYHDLLEELRARTNKLSFSLGCDFHLSEENVELAAKNPCYYTIGDSRFILVELSDYTSPRQIKNSLLRLHCMGLATIVTHPERNAMVKLYPKLASEMVDMGALLQLTADSLVGGRGRAIRKLSESLVKSGLISVIASDAHEDRVRLPILSRARQVACKLVGATAAADLVETNPQEIVEDRRNE